MTKPYFPKNLLGQRGEEDARSFLEKNKRMKFVAKNFRTRWGELDLVMEDQGIIVFVEVKARVLPSLGSPLEYIDPSKIKHLKKAVDFYLNRSREVDRLCRMDAVGLEYKMDEAGDLKLKNTEYVQDLTGW